MKKLQIQGKQKKKIKGKKKNEYEKNENIYENKYR